MAKKTLDLYLFCCVSTLYCNVVVLFFPEICQMKKKSCFHGNEMKCKDSK